VEKLVPVWRIL